MVKKDTGAENGEANNQKPISYTLPFVDNPVAHETVFELRGENPILLRPTDVERLYGIPASTVYDWIHDQAETHFPCIKLAVKDESKRRLVLIPKQLLDEWIVERQRWPELNKTKNFIPNLS